MNRDKHVTFHVMIESKGHIVEVWPQEAITEPGEALLAGMGILLPKRYVGLPTLFGGFHCLDVDDMKALGLSCNQCDWPTERPKGVSDRDWQASLFIRDVLASLVEYSNARLVFGYTTSGACVSSCS